MTIQQMLLGASGLVPVELTPVTARRTVAAPGTATSTYRVLSDGTVNVSSGIVVTPDVLPETWLVAGSASEYEVMFTVLGTNPAPVVAEGTFGSWLSLATDRAVILRAGFSSDNPYSILCSADIRIQFRRSGVEVGSVDIKLEAHSQP